MKLTGANERTEGEGGQGEENVRDVLGAVAIPAHAKDAVMGQVELLKFNYA